MPLMTICFLIECCDLPIAISLLNPEDWLSLRMISELAKINVIFAWKKIWDLSRDTHRVDWIDFGITLEQKVKPFSF